MKRVTLLLSLTLLLLSCSSDDDSATPLPEENFYALTVGNSWVYKNYRYNFNTQEYDDTGVIDSISVVAQEDVLGVSYFKVRRLTTGNENHITFCNLNGEHFEYLREFEGNLVTSDGKIKFTNSNYEERTLGIGNNFSLYEILIEGFSDIDVNAGTFNCIYSERYARYDNGDQYPALDRFYYADGIGLIYDTSSYASNPIPSIIRRLDSYNVQ